MIAPIPILLKLKQDVEDEEEGELQIVEMDARMGVDVVVVPLLHRPMQLLLLLVQPIPSIISLRVNDYHASLVLSFCLFSLEP